jgi:glycosyltransferase involved in cell wall biosynthesis
VKPLLTFAIAALNQERFIREAVESAFAQTYSPLEIILSDDHSEDRTFQIMSEMAATYRGPHRLILNQNPARRCIGGHVNRIVKLSSGEIILAAAGDDISLPHRSQATYEAWDADGRKATSLHSSIIQIDEEGKPIQEVFGHLLAAGAGGLTQQKANPADYVRTLEPLIYGCAHAFSRRLFDTFGNLPEAVIHEDNALGLRSIIAGNLLFINKPLVKYRVHESNIFIGGKRRFTDMKSLARQEERFGRQFRNRQVMYEGFRPDLEKAKNLGLIPPADFEDATAHCNRMIRRLSLIRQFLESGFFTKWRLVSALKREGLDASELKGLKRRLLPRNLLLWTRLLRNYRALAFQGFQQKERV